MAWMPYLGCGVGLRSAHLPDFLNNDGLGCPWVEAISENHMVAGGPALRVLEAVRRDRPVVLHGVSMAIGSCDPLDRGYLRSLKQLIDIIQPAWVSDHLCWGNLNGHTSHDLLPLPNTHEALDHVVTRVQQVQEILQRPLVLENISTYVRFKHDEMQPWEFTAAVAERADCGLLFDVNNAYVSAQNHGFDAMQFVRGLPAHRIAQIHLAGHTDRGNHLLDTHDGPVCDAVWQLYAATIARVGPVSTLIEWDDKLPDLATVLGEAQRAAHIIDAQTAKMQKVKSA